MGFLDRFGVRLDRREVDKVPMKFGLVLRPQGLHGQHRLARDAPAPWEVSAKNLGFLFEPASADAKDEASAGNLIQGGDFLGRMQWVTLWHQADTRAEFDLRRDGRG